MWDITAIGELLMDMAPVAMENTRNDDLAYLPKPGGAPANCVAQLTRLGRKGAMIGRVGNDVFGNKILKSLEKANMDVSCVQRDEEAPTTLAFVSLDEQGDREFTFYRKASADLRLVWNRAMKEQIENSRIFHIGTLSMADDPSRTTTIEALECAQKAGVMISFDPNFRLNLWPSFDALHAVTALIFPYVDVAKISGDELLAFYHPKLVRKAMNKKGMVDYQLPPAAPDDEALQQAITDILNRYPNLKLLAVSFGCQGSILAVRGKTVFIPAFSVQAVDTTGSGDAFMGAILYSLLIETDRIAMDKGITSLSKPCALARLSWENLPLQDMGTFANACGAYAAMNYGGISSLGKREEVEEMMREVRNAQ